MDTSSEIKFLKAKVALLETEKKHLIQKLADLEKKKSEAPYNILSSRINTPIVVFAESSADFPIEQKIQLLRNAFRGREDVHARYWISKKTGKKGYSPVCKNEWIRNICKKPAIKCSACPSREFSPLTDDVIEKHLEGMCSVGIYPYVTGRNLLFFSG